ncbi:unnamed protein product [Sphagnum jensenii]
MEEDTKVGDQPLAQLAGSPIWPSFQRRHCKLQAPAAAAFFLKIWSFVVLWSVFLAFFGMLLCAFCGPFRSGQNVREEPEHYQAKALFGIPVLECVFWLAIVVGAFTKDSCDGHFGHIVLPMPVYHPFHVAFTQQIPSKVSIICYKLTVKTGMLTIENELEINNTPATSGLSHDIIANDSQMLAYENITKIVAKLLYGNPHAQLFVMGHSLGGAAVYGTMLHYNAETEIADRSIEEALKPARSVPDMKLDNCLGLNFANDLVRLVTVWCCEFGQSPCMTNLYGCQEYCQKDTVEHNLF